MFAVPAVPRLSVACGLALALLLLPGPAHEASAAPGDATSDSDGLGSKVFEREDVLGTSMRLVVVTDDETAAGRAEGVVLAAIERERKIFSTYDPKSELSVVNALPWKDRDNRKVSGHLGSLLNSARSWQRRSSGAFDVYVAGLSTRWRQAAKAGAPPTPEELASLVGPADGSPRFKVPRRRGKRRLTCAGPGRFDLGGIAKGYIIDRALRALRKKKLVDGALLDIGGDVGVYGASPQGSRAPWKIGVADPRAPEDNAPPLTALYVRSQAVASSGGYARFFEIDGQRHSHILDPRSGQPADGVLGATVVADDAQTADALATILCVLGPKEGLALLEKTPGAAGLVVDAAGKEHPSRRWTALTQSKPKASRRAKGKQGSWPKGFAVRVGFTLVNSTGRSFKRHGVAVWVEDEAGRRVRLLALWFHRKELKHVKGLRTFWRGAWIDQGESSNPKDLATVARATRPPGQHTLLWDGLDDKGRRTPPGLYRIRISVNREHGPPNKRERETVATVEIECARKKKRARAVDQPELKGVTVHYGSIRR